MSVLQAQKDVKIGAERLNRAVCEKVAAGEVYRKDEREGRLFWGEAKE